METNYQWKYGSHTSIDILFPLFQEGSCFASHRNAYPREDKKSWNIKA